MGERCGVPTYWRDGRRCHFDTRVRLTAKVSYFGLDRSAVGVKLLLSASCDSAGPTQNVLLR